jgi:hypothetical protein
MYQISFYVPTEHVQVVKNVLFDASVGNQFAIKMINRMGRIQKKPCSAVLNSFLNITFSPF